MGRATDAELAVDLTGKAVAALIVPLIAGAQHLALGGVAICRCRGARAVGAPDESRRRGRGARKTWCGRAIEFYGAVSARGTYGLDTAGAVTRPRAAAPVLLVRQRLLGALQATGARLSAMLTSESFTYPR
ncbi:MAG: hypothetical protein IPK33_00115 [Gemmatimonadetes bacterium]|nr:hypothetical protein [Gemmatimonadota bacterium]